MMNSNELDTIGRQFLIRLFEQTNGDSSQQVSMYDIGDQLGLERDAASSVAQELIASMLVEIRTLSGGIGISAAGSQTAKELIGPAASGGDELAKLVDAPILDSTGQQAIEQIAVEVKNQVGRLGLDFDTITELTADLKTIDAQLGSSRPKTGIIRECLYSILEVMKKSGNSKISNRIQSLLGG